MPLEDAQEAAKLLRSHHEHFDGSGYPDRLRGTAIPLGARILAVANDYDALQTGTMLERTLSAAEARDHLIAAAGKLYDPEVVEALCAALQGHMLELSLVRTFDSASVQPGMVLSRDLLSPAGVLLLAAGHALQTGHIARLHEFEKAESVRLEIHVAPAKE